MDNTTTAATTKALLPDFTTPRFSIITKAMGGTTDGDGRRRFRATASSTITDRQDDEISLKALTQMAEKFRAGVTIFTDHHNEVANAFGRTDGAQIIQRGNDPKTGAAIWDLDIEGVVNEPNPAAVQLHDSIAGGYVQFGCSIDAMIPSGSYTRKKSGGLSIDGLDVFAASIVGVPANQRSWTQKAVRAIKGFEANAEESDMPDEDDLVVEKAVDEAAFQPEEVADGVPIPAVDALVKAMDTADGAALDRQDIEHSPKCLTCAHEGDCGCSVCDCGDAVHDTDRDGDSAADIDLDGKSLDALAAEFITTKSITTDGQEADAATPETASVVADTDTDPAEVRKALGYEADDVMALVKHVQTLVGRITDRDEKIAAMSEELTAVKAERDRLASENDEARAVIEKVMRMPLRPKTVGYVADFSKRLPDFLAPDVRDYLSKTT